MLPDRLKLDVNFSVERLQADLEKLEQLDWIDHFVKNNYEGDWDILPLRGPRGADHPIRMAYSDPTCSTFEDTPFLKEALYFQEVLNTFPFELHAVRLMGLSPRSRIKEHRDYDLSVEDKAFRLHVPIRTHDNVEFMLNETQVRMQEGECWYLRLSDPHSVYNGSDIKRVHMVIDAPVTPGVTAYFGTSIINRPGQ